jgi:hypothetical protein
VLVVWISEAGKLALVQAFGGVMTNRRKVAGNNGCLMRLHF